MTMLAHQEKFRIFGHKVPQYFWFMVSGGICDILQALLDYGVSIIYISTWEKVTVCWTVSYILSIWARHYTHKMLVFGDYEGSYWASLWRLYVAYFGSIVLSGVTNRIMVSNFGFTHMQAWIVTMLWTGIFNYFMIRNSWKGTAEKEKVVADLV
mmetsp:Transcript_54590/g.95443  ORF Transcript_54590/g.95443 Transcript_54590/m.95443 type:complete len:154 (-) Transcript_54590:230-691(-)